KSYRDIADALGVGAKAVDNALNRAKRKLEK
ncbi:MAG: sigma factor-like helix-turn-helix DNA-binding protein, partial [Actinomycetota bacterium]